MQCKDEIELKRGKHNKNAFQFFVWVNEGF